MSRQCLAVLCLVFVMIALSVIPATAQTTPRTAWGDPDLGGHLGLSHHHTDAAP